MPRRIALLAVLAACGANPDRPSWVHDLRILAVRLEPPEMLIAPQALASGYTPPPVEVQALVADPAGDGRTITWFLRACAEGASSVGGGGGFQPISGAVGACPDSEATIEVNSGVTSPDGVRTSFMPSGPFLLDALRRDPFKGFGGLRILLELEVIAGEERVTAVKRMVYGAPLVPGQTANRNPELLDFWANGAPTHGLALDGEPWAAPIVPCVERYTRSELTPTPKPDSGESYVVPTFELKSRTLKEALRYFWFATSGRIDNQTGGATLGRAEGRITATWSAGGDDPDAPVTFWLVVRDGRGGAVWTKRTATLRESCWGLSY